jgi:hypothetical protein
MANRGCAMGDTLGCRVLAGIVRARVRALEAGRP